MPMPTSSSLPEAPFMRSYLRSGSRIAVTSALLATALVWSGCDSKKQTEYVAGVSTQVQVPRDLRAVRISVSIGGFTQFCQGYKVYDGVVRLPRSLGTFAQNDPKGSGPITYSITGYTDDLPEGSEFGLDECQDAVGMRGARILRRSRQPYIFEEVKFLPLPLKYSCYDHTGCDASEKTCKGGRCVDAAIDGEKLPRFSEDLVDGTGSTCFPVTECFAPAVPPATVDANDCTYALPGSISAPPVTPPFPQPPKPFGDGINVEITYDGGLTSEILDKDPEEGFTIPDPAKPQRYRLAPGLCDMVKGIRPDGTEPPHRITSMRVTGACRAKSPFQPLCANDLLAAMGTPGTVSSNLAPAKCSARELKPAKSILMVVADQTKNSDIFYNGADRAALEISLADPAFTRTEIGLTFFPGNAACPNPPGTFAPTEAPKLATLARDPIGAAFKSRGDNNDLLKPLDAPTDLDGALRDTYALLRDAKYAAYNRRAVLVIGNRNFDANACDALTPNDQPSFLAADAKANGGINTYVVMLARQPSELPDAPVGSPGGVPFQPLADAIAQAGTTNPPIPGAFDARRPADKARGQDAFRRIVDDLATCVYDVEAASSAPTPGDFVSFSNPVPLPPAPDQAKYVIKHDPACNTEGASANGWGIDSAKETRVRLCGQACTNYRDVVKKASAYAIQYSQPSLPVPVFAFKKECEPK